MFCMSFSEIMGYSTRTIQADSNESVYHVHGGQLYLYLPHHDGWYDVPKASQGSSGRQIK